MVLSCQASGQQAKCKQGQFEHAIYTSGYVEKPSMENILWQFSLEHHRKPHVAHKGAASMHDETSRPETSQRVFRQWCCALSLIWATSCHSRLHRSQAACLQQNCSGVKGQSCIDRRTLNTSAVTASLPTTQVHSCRTSGFRQLTLLTLFRILHTSSPATFSPAAPCSGDLVFCRDHVPLYDVMHSK